MESNKERSKKVGNENAELATNVKSKVTDNKSIEWVGEDGQDIYIDDGNEYYWIMKKVEEYLFPRTN